MAKVPKQLQGKDFSANPQNRNSKGIRGVRGPHSKISKLSNELFDRVPKAMEIIDNILDDKEEEKERVQLAKWLIERAVSVRTAALNEERAKLAIIEASKNSSEQDNSVGEEDNSEPEVPVKRFSLHMIPSLDKKDE